jgi:hypothetical protein
VWVRASRRPCVGNSTERTFRGPGPFRGSESRDTETRVRLPPVCRTGQLRAAQIFAGFRPRLFERASGRRTHKALATTARSRDCLPIQKKCKLKHETAKVGNFSFFGLLTRTGRHPSVPSAKRQGHRDGSLARARFRVAAPLICGEPWTNGAGRPWCTV